MCIRDRIMAVSIISNMLHSSSYCMRHSWPPTFGVLCLNQLVLVACLLAGCLEGAREVSSRQAITPARYDGGTLATNHNTAQGRGDIITLAHPEGSHMQIDKRIRRELNRAENSENGSKMRHFTTHSHTSNLQGRSRLTRTKRLRR